ncbi:MAG TPA: thioredoxin family protein [Acidiferrobacterales bacterium]|nr:thioredoxin family protein [Acidiferrobacterales bacterium]
MPTTRKIEVFSAGCAVCEDTIVLINRIACPSCDVEILDMHKPDVAKKAKRYGIRSVPAVAVNGKLVDCCADRGPNEGALRTAGIGTPI